MTAEERLAEAIVELQAALRLFREGKPHLAHPHVVAVIQTLKFLHDEITSTKSTTPSN